MSDLREDFALLLEESCQIAFPRCEALLNLPDIKPLVDSRPTNDRKIFLLKEFLKAAVQYAVERSPLEEQKNIRAAAACIGLEPWLGKAKQRRYDAAADKLGRSERTARDPDRQGQYVRTLIQAVTDFLKDRRAVDGFVSDLRLSLRSTTPITSEAATTTSIHPAYVHRPKLEDQFRKMLNANSQIIVVVGQPGMGKTWLAEELIRNPDSGEPAPLLDVSKPEYLARDQAGAFAGIGIPEVLDTDSVARLARLVCGDHAPPIVILDNLDSADQLGKLLPRHPRSRIVATCRQASDRQPSPYTTLYVDKMERDESVALIQGYLPNFNRDDADFLATVFSDYPLVIAHVCGLLRWQQVPLKPLCSSLQADARRLADQVETEDQAVLLAILRRTIRLVARRNKLSLELLTLMSFIGYRVSRPLLKQYFATFVREGPVAAGVSFVLALGVLKEFALIRIDESSEAYVEIHPFTQDILRQEFESRSREIFARVSHVVVSMTESRRNATSSMPEILREAMNHNAAAFVNDLINRAVNLDPKEAEPYSEEIDQARREMIEDFLKHYGGPS